MVLIVPLWNWNVFCLFFLPGNKSFNRTFMELKWLIIHFSCCIHIQVLIVPLWNWNGSNVQSFSWRSIVLIVPLWNWNPSSTTKREQSWCFNRTFMELKLAFIIAAAEEVSWVLIVPLWNWNYEDGAVINGGYSFNRTFMELKFVILCRLDLVGMF